MNLNVIIPMAGKGTRFADYGFQTPKFLLPINDKGETMIHSAVDTLNAKNLNPSYTFITLKSNLNDAVQKEMSEYNPEWVVLEEITDGPATTVFQGLKNVNNDSPLLISNSDQILVNWDCENFIKRCSGYDGGVLTYTPNYEVKIGDKDKHSYVELKNGTCSKFAEKIVLSNQALIGVHYFRNKETFLNAYYDMKSRNERAPNGEFYLSLMYNALVRANKTVIHVPLLPNELFFPTGEPADYFHYLNTISKFGPRSFPLSLPYIFKSDLLTVRKCSPKELIPNSVYYNLQTHSIVSRPLLKDSDCICITSPLLTEKVNTNISAFFRGWLIGDFTPSLVRTKEFEIGILSHKAGEKWPYHIHDKQDEYNYLINGTMTVNDILYSTGDTFVLYKGHPAVPIFKSNCTVLCFKFPSIPSDKRII